MKIHIFALKMLGNRIYLSSRVASSTSLFFSLILIYKVYMYNGYYIELKFVTMLVRFSMVVHLSVNCKFAEIQSA